MTKSSPADAQEDALALRMRLLKVLQAAVDHSEPNELALMQACAELEMEQDPRWMELHGGSDWNWATFISWMAHPMRFGTHIFTQLFVKTAGIDVEVWENGKCRFREGEWGGQPIRLCRAGQHYDLMIINRRLRRKTGMSLTQCKERAKVECN